jgi:hypothetical protein
MMILVLIMVPLSSIAAAQSKVDLSLASKDKALVNVSIAAVEFKNFSIRAIVEIVSYENKEDILTFDSKEGHTIKIYSLPATSQYDNGIEYEVIYKTNPESETEVFAIKTEGLDFFYQGELSANSTATRPENVVNSYAVYYKNGGKAFHIYRPKLIAADKKEIYTNMSIDEKTGELIISLPIDWLKTAAYPVILDPTFGYTVKGASYNNWGDGYIWGTNASATANGTISNITITLSQNGANTPVLTCAIYYSGERKMKTVPYTVTSGLDGNVTLNLSSPTQVVNNSMYRFVCLSSYYVNYYYDDVANYGYLATPGVLSTYLPTGSVTTERISMWSDINVGATTSSTTTTTTTLPVKVAGIHPYIFTNGNVNNTPGKILNDVEHQAFSSNAETACDASYIRQPVRQAIRPIQSRILKRGLGPLEVAKQI